MQFDLLLIALFLGPALVGVGFIMGVLTERHRQTLNMSDLDWMVKTRKEADRIVGKEPELQITPPPEEFGLTDNLSEIHPGIIYRPTAEELEKMHEPELVRQAKEEIAKTLSEERSPEE